MKNTRRHLLEPGFWSQSAVIWGFSTGNVLALTLTTVAAYSLTHNSLVTHVVCGLTLFLAAWPSLYIVREGHLAPKMRTPAERIGGFFACTVGGFVIPFAVIPLLIDVIREERARPRVSSPAGEVAVFSLPGSVARHAEHGLSASFFSEHKV